MPSIRQRQKAKRDEHNKHEARIANQRLEKAKKEIMDMKGPFGTLGERATKPISISKPYRREVPDYPSAPLTSHVPKAKPRYTGVMAERERIAQEEIEKKKKRVAPSFNKGPYQYITDETDLKTMGRKI